MSTTSSSPPVSVVLVEDDDAVRSAVSRALGVHGLEVVETSNAEQAIAEVLRRLPGVMIVDVGLPGMSGIELCATLRDSGVDVPILILSARDQVGDRVEGLHAGADDYLVKPFDLDELLARITALMRRANRVATAPTSAVSVGGLLVDQDRRSANFAGHPLDLSRREFDLLSALATNAGIVMSRIRLLELVWGYDFEVETNVVDVFVGYLRRKLTAAGADDVIATVRGIGFTLKKP